jgi:hypothetical protein
MRVNVRSPNVDPLCDTIQSEVLGRALVEGAEYIWNSAINAGGRVGVEYIWNSAINAGGRVSLLWRTEIDDDSLEGASGSVLI